MAFINEIRRARYKINFAIRNIFFRGNKYLDFYIKHKEIASNGAASEYVNISNHPSGEHSIKAIAFYLPQFHPIDENDQAWGKGFTEWTNTTKAFPQFETHYQPRLPGELGFYDLRIESIQERQIELAKHYGIHGFCYHYYWFEGKKLLDTPIQSLLQNNKLNFPFCICWANENWTKRWDGNESEIIIKQRHSPENDINFIKDITPLLNDARYIKVDEKPIIVIYRPSLFPDFKTTLKRWRQYAIDAGIGEIFVVGTTAFGFRDYKSYELDGIVQFPPHNANCRHKDLNDLNILNPKFKGSVFEYTDAAKNFLMHLKRYPDTIPTVMMGWDNEARKPGRGTIFANCTPEKYKDWINKMCKHTKEHKKTEDTVIFINAWNEWSEGTYLEPDRRFGYAYLKATAEALAESENLKKN